MWSFRQPTGQTIRSFLSAQTALDFSYVEIGRSRGAAQAGYDFDHHRIQLGRGQVAYLAACEGVRQWRMFPDGWTLILPRHVPVRKGQVVAMVARVGGIWWWNACRIVYVVDNQPLRRFGFAYGTLPGHVEQGEECFSVEWLPDNTVWYDLRAFSRPRFWMARLGYPFVRHLQRRFARESLRSMLAAVAHAAGAAEITASRAGL